MRPTPGDRRVVAGPEGGRRPPAGSALNVRGCPYHLPCASPHRRDVAAIRGRASQSGPGTAGSRPGQHHAGPLQPHDAQADEQRRRSHGPVVGRGGVTCSLLLLSEPSLPPRSCLECLLGGVRVLVGPPVFKTGVSSDPAQAGSIPVRLRYHGLQLSTAPSSPANLTFWHGVSHGSTLPDPAAVISKPRDQLDGLSHAGWAGR